MPAARAQQPRRASLAVPTFAVGIPLLLLSLGTANPGHTAAAIASAMCVALLLWRPGEPPVLLFVAGMQWLQGAVEVFHADVLGEPLYAMSETRGLEDATLLTLIWVAVFALGLRLALIGRAPVPLAEVPLGAISPRLAFRIYLAWTAALVVLERVPVGGLRQALVAATDFRWAIVFALFWMVLRQRQNWHLLGLVFVAEVATGFLSFFSDFKTPVYLLAIAALAADYRLRARQALGFALVGVFALYLGTLWSAIKMDYRDTLNEGTGKQVTTISRGEQVRALLDLLGTVDAEVLEVGLDNFVERFAYVEQFARVLDYVPAMVGHADGELHAAALRHVLMPRLFFPNKPALVSDTEMAERYTGHMLVYEGRATSISVGTPADGYIDYGYSGMHLSALLLGLLVGLSYRFVLTLKGQHQALASSLAVALVLPLSTVEQTVVKLVGGMLTRVILVVLLWKFAIPMALSLLASRRRHQEAKPSSAR